MLVLVYNIYQENQIYDRFIGIEGSAYMVGGLGVNFQSNEELKLAPIRTGVGARLGANVGYLKYTQYPTLNPFLPGTGCGREQRITNPAGAAGAVAHQFLSTVATGT